MTLDEFEKRNEESKTLLDSTYSGMGWPRGAKDEYLLRERLIAIERKIDDILICVHLI